MFYLLLGYSSNGSLMIASYQCEHRWTYSDVQYAHRTLVHWFIDDRCGILLWIPVQLADGRKEGRNKMRRLLHQIRSNTKSRSTWWWSGECRVLTYLIAIPCATWWHRIAHCCCCIRPPTRPRQSPPLDCKRDVSIAAISAATGYVRTVQYGTSSSWCCQSLKWQHMWWWAAAAHEKHNVCWMVFRPIGSRSLGVFGGQSIIATLLTHGQCVTVVNRNCVWIAPPPSFAAYSAYSPYTAPISTSTWISPSSSSPNSVASSLAHRCLLCCCCTSKTSSN